jgi:uncharacterized protein (TIGR02118 family)
MSDVELLIAADTVPAVITARLADAAADVRTWRSVSESRTELARYVHWEGDPDDIPVRLACATATLPDLASCERFLQSADVAPELGESRGTVDVVGGVPRVIVDGDAVPGMVRASYIFRRLHNRSPAAFRDHWLSVHGELWAKVPGVVRYVQHHPPGEGAVPGSPFTHDGWSDVWFADLDSYARALSSAEREAVSVDGATLLDYASLRIFVTYEE